jgi:hypothetical protein
MRDDGEKMLATIDEKINKLAEQANKLMNYKEELKQNLEQRINQRLLERKTKT